MNISFVARVCISLLNWCGKFLSLQDGKLADCEEAGLSLSL